MSAPFRPMIFAMACDEGNGDVKIDNPYIAVVMIGSGLSVP